MKSFTTFISPEDLITILDNPQLVIIDCRFDLSNPAWGYQDYIKNHIHNAIYADLDQDLSGLITENTGRHPLPERSTFIETCSQWGIDESKQVVVYDTTSGSFASRLWWMLKYLGHHQVAILDGGFTAWTDSGYPLAVGRAQRKKSSFAGIPDEYLLVTTSEMENMIDNADYAIVDARSRERYLGLEEPIDKIAGHIPNANNFFHGNNLDSSGRLLPDDKLKQLYADLLPKNSAVTTVLYCGSGVTSCLNFAVMQHIGIKKIKLYLGSWSEWIRNPDHPIIKEENQGSPK